MFKNLIFRNPAVTSDNMHCAEAPTSENPWQRPLCLCWHCGGASKARVSTWSCYTDTRYFIFNTRSEKCKFRQVSFYKLFNIGWTLYQKISYLWKYWTIYIYIVTCTWTRKWHSKRLDSSIAIHKLLIVIS